MFLSIYVCTCLRRTTQILPQISVHLCRFNMKFEGIYNYWKMLGLHLYIIYTLLPLKAACRLSFHCIKSFCLCIRMCHQSAYACVCIFVLACIFCVCMYMHTYICIYIPLLFRLLIFNNFFYLLPQRFQSQNNDPCLKFHPQNQINNSNIP